MWSIESLDPLPKRIPSCIRRRMISPESLFGFMLSSASQAPAVFSLSACLLMYFSVSISDTSLPRRSGLLSHAELDGHPWGQGHFSRECTRRFVSRMYG